MKRASIAAVVLAALGLILWASLRQSGEEGGEGVYAERARQREITQVVKATGTLDASVSVDLSAHVVAKIETLYVEEGDEVTAGQPFLELEKEAFQAALESWRAQRRQADARVRQAEIDLQDARVRLGRNRRLAEEGIVSAEQLESSELRVRSAELRLEQERDAVAHAEANLAKALDDYGKTTLYAPVSGRVVDLAAEQGEVVVSGVMNNPATKIATIADLSELLAVVEVDESEIVSVEIGQPVEVEVDAVGDRSYRGTVVEIGSSGFTRPGQGDVRFFEVRVLLEEPDDVLRPGMSLRAEIEVDSRTDALVVPIQAVVEREPREEDGGGEEGDDGGDGDAVDVVYVVEDGVARRRRVETGLSDLTHVELVSGVAADERVITGPFRTLRDLEDGDAVRVEDPGADEEEEER